jgi:hypothetical protein
VTSDLRTVAQLLEELGLEEREAEIDEESETDEGPDHMKRGHGRPLARGADSPRTNHRAARKRAIPIPK